MSGDNGKSHAVWVIDDEDCVRDITVSTLAKAGYAVTEFRTADDALARIKAGEVPGAVVCDGRSNIGGMDGPEFFEEAHPYLGECARYLCTGGLRNGRLPDTEAIRAIRKVIKKPFKLQALTRIVGAGFGKPAEKVLAVNVANNGLYRLDNVLDENGFDVNVQGEDDASALIDSGYVPDCAVGAADTGSLPALLDIYLKSRMHSVPRIVATYHPDRVLADLDRNKEMFAGIEGIRVFDMSERYASSNISDVVEACIARPRDAAD